MTAILNYTIKGQLKVSGEDLTDILEVEILPDELSESDLDLVKDALEEGIIDDSIENQTPEITMSQEP